MTQENESNGSAANPTKQLTLFDSTCLIVGIIIGAGVYQMSPAIAKGAFCWWGVLAIWVVGGLLSLFGALGYAELATAFPQEGGDYVYLNRAYGRWSGFLFGWIQLAVVRPGDIAIMAFAFAMYAQQIYDPFANGPMPYGRHIYAIAATLLLTAINIVGVREGKWTQNLLTTVKALGIMGIVVVVLLAPDRSPETTSVVRGEWSVDTLEGEQLAEGESASIRFDMRGAGSIVRGDDVHELKFRATPSGAEFDVLGEAGESDVIGSGEVTVADDAAASLNGQTRTGQLESSDFTAQRFFLPLSLALIFVLFAFGGWNEMAYVAAEVKDPNRNIVRALVVGTIAVTVLYLLINGAFLYTLGYYGLAASDAVAADAVSMMFPGISSRLISIMICISALGAVNGLIFTGARISYAVGKDHRLFRVLGGWNPSTGTPARALFVQGLIAVAMIVTLASFEDTVLYTAAPVYGFFLATNLAVIILRFKEPGAERPYRVTGYPFTTVIFCAVCAYLIYRAVDYRPVIAVAAIVILSLGLPLYWLSSRGENGLVTNEEDGADE